MASYAFPCECGAETPATEELPDDLGPESLVRWYQTCHRCGATLTLTFVVGEMQPEPLSDF